MYNRLPDILNPIYDLTNKQPADKITIAGQAIPDPHTK